MRSYTYAEVVDAVLLKLKENAIPLGVESSSIVEDAEGIRQSLGTPFVVVTATPQETTLLDASGRLLQNKLDVILFVGVGSFPTQREATRASMALAGRVLTVLDEARNTNDFFADLFVSSPPIEYLGSWSNKTIVSITFEIDFDPFTPVLS